MAVKYYRGLIYIGGVTSKQRTDAPQLNMGDVNSDQTNLRGYVYSLDPETGVITEVLQFPFSYRRSHLIDQYRYEFKTNWWRAWQNNGDADILRNDFNDALEAFPQPAAPYNTSQNTGIIYPQPMLADIEFDTDGAMVLGIRDRFGDQSGLNNYLEGENGNQPTSGNQYFRGFAAGEVLRAGKNGATYALENNAAVTNNGVSSSSNLADVQGIPPAGTYAQSGSFATLSGAPFGWASSTNQGYGPGGRYFYYNHAFTSAGVPISNLQDGNFDGSVVHYTKAFGGIGILPGSDEIVLTTLSPEGRPFTSGLLRFSNNGLTAGTNSGNMTDQQELVPGTAFASPGTGSDPSSFGKCNGIGDVEVLSDAMPIEIGNRIWLDANNNGFQDANENGIPNVTVLLRSPGIDGIYATADDQVWTTVSSNVAGAEGYYYFDNSLINDNRRTVLGYIGLPANSGVLNNQLYRIEIDPAQPALSGYTPTLSNAGGLSKEHIDNDGALANLAGIGDRLYVNINTANNNYNFDFGVRGSVLPIAKLELSASLTNEIVKLKWQTLDEVNTSKFYIERSNKNSGQFLPIAEQLAANNTQGITTYTAVDNISSFASDAIFYRIKLLNQDASFKYSNIVSVKKTATQNLQIWPMPFTKIINISFNSTVDYTASIVLFDQLGKQIESINKTVIKGLNFISITPKNNLPKGIYFIKIIDENGMIVNTRKLIKQ